MEVQPIIDALNVHLPAVMRWGGAVARRMRSFNIALDSKHSGSSNTDALTLADLTVQELLVSALRDCDPIFRRCRIEAEESTGDLAWFAKGGKFTLALDPIDGTKQYRDKTGNGYAVILTLRSVETVHYSLVYAPESGPCGGWMRACAGKVVCGSDDPARPAAAALDNLPPISLVGRSQSPKIYMIGFLNHGEDRARAVTAAGLEGVPADDCPGCLYELLATGEYGGSLIHSPNVYDFPAGLQIAREFGGDSIWVHNGQSVNFEELWLDERASMLRLPGIIATSPSRQILSTLASVARDWNPVRYAD